MNIVGLHFLDVCLQTHLLRYAPCLHVYTSECALLKISRHLSTSITELLHVRNTVTGGPFSVLQEVAVAFTLTGVREVCVRKVDRRDVALDMVELSFKDQYITRSDMWRITCSLVCIYMCTYGTLYTRGRAF